ncbi:hypothetical protein PQQ99_01100 [Paraburkholderia sediminicola]|uniref:hypothetical protein n=1 Tax=Paraburkholderia sediminicola TaxID=458836 RepID=UPI0038BA11DF
MAIQQKPRGFMQFHSTITEIGAAFLALSDDNQKALSQYAARHIGGTSFAEPEDLIQETITRALEGTRRWPKHVPFTLFMCLTMRSVAEGDRSRNDNKFTAPISAEAFVDRPSPLQKTSPSIEDHLITYERMAQAAVAVCLARSALEGDEQAQRVIDALVFGMTPREACAEFLMSLGDFDSARHRAARRLRDAGMRVERCSTRAELAELSQTVASPPSLDIKNWRQRAPTPQGMPRNIRQELSVLATPSRDKLHA